MESIRSDRRRRESVAVALRVTATLAILATAGGCTTTVEQASDEIPVVVALPPLAYLVDRVCGDRCAVTTLLQRGRSPHVYEPSPRSLTAMHQARLWLGTGGSTFPLEARAVSILSSLKTPPALLSFPASAPPDSHPWLDPRAMATMAQEIAEELAGIRPAEEERYRSAASDFAIEVEGLIGDVARIVEGLPRSVWVSHPAWGSFCKTWGLRQIALEVDGKEPGPAQLIEKIQQARRDNVRAFLTIRGETSRAADVFARETGARQIALDPLGYDWPATIRDTARAICDANAEQAKR